MLKCKLRKNKSEWDKIGVDFENFIKAEKTTFKYTRKGYKHEYLLFKDAINLHTRSMGYVYNLLQGGDGDLFYNIFIKLCTKTLHNVEGIRNLIYLGLYGSANILYRSLLFDTMMIWYLYFNPHLLEEWLDETFEKYKDREWRNKFSEKSIIECIKEKGKKYKLLLNYDLDFAFYSKAAHPCHFGLRFFQNDNNVLSYLPDLSMKIGHFLLIQTLSLIPYPTQVLLEKEKDKKRKSGEIQSIRNKYNYIMNNLNEFGKRAVKFHKDYLGAKPKEGIRET